MSALLAGAGQDKFPEVEGQLQDAMVEADCSHCPTIWFRVQRDVAPSIDAQGEPLTDVMPFHALGRDRDGMGIDALLHVVNGYVHELEVYRYDGLPFLELPAVGRFDLTLTDSYEQESLD